MAKEPIKKEYNRDRKLAEVELWRLWEAEKLFSKEKYTLKEAYGEFIKADRLLDQYTRNRLSNIPMLEKELKKEHININALWDIAYSYSFQLLKNAGLDKKEKEYIERLVDEKNYLVKNKLQNQIRIRELGVKGEEKFYQSIRIIGDKIRILRNLRLKVDDLEVEHDVLIIAPGGIFTIEIKNLSSDSVINEKGVLVSRNKSFNVAEQSRRHMHNLKRFLGNLSYDIPIYPIILWANDYSKIQNNFGYISVCYCNSLEYEMFNEKKYPVVLSRDDIEVLYKYLKGYQLAEKTYPIKFDIEKYKKYYLDVIVAISCGIKKAEKEEADEESAKTIRDTILDIIGILEILSAP